jgi:hypothetical protein
MAAAPAPALALVLALAPAPRASSRPARVELRSTPCLACANSALAGKSEKACYNTLRK